MKNTFAALAAVSLIGIASPVFAHPEDNFYDSPQPKPIRVEAKEAVVKLVTQSKLPASWAKAEAIDASFVRVRDNERWVVTFENPAIAKASERKLYVMLTAGREFVSASFKPS